MSARASDAKLVALVPIKAHSARVPGKNFRDFCGRPLFRWILDTLLSLPEIAQVVVNSDTRARLEAAGFAEHARLVLRERAAELRGDEVSMNRVLADDVRHVAADVYLMTHATNPLLGAATVRRALDAFRAARERGEADSLFAANRLQSRFWRADGSAVNHDPDDLLPTQRLEPWYEENSNLYLFTRESFARTRARIGERPLVFATPPWESLDIDDEDSWRHAELVARGLRTECRTPEVPL